MKTEEEIIKQIESGKIDYRAELMDFMDITENLLKIDSNREKQINGLVQYLRRLSRTSVALSEKIKKLELSKSNKYINK